jgi:HK97 family phage major capsid protein
VEDRTVQTTMRRHPLAAYGTTAPVIGYRKSGAPIHAVAGGAPNPLLERAVQEREQVLSRIESVSAAAFEANRDLSEQDQDTIKRARERVEFLDGQIDTLSFDTALSDRAQAALRSNGVSSRHSSPTQFRSAGDALHTMLAAGRGEPDARQRYDVEMNRAAQHMGADAANTVAVAGGLGALVVKPVVGPVIDLTPRGRPFLTALGVRQLESPLGFSRPRIVDKNGAEAPAPQGKEKQELVSRAFDVKLDSIDSETIGEYLNISQKLLSLPIDGMNMILDRFTVRRQRMTERRAILEVLETTSSVTLAAPPAPGTAEDPGAIYDAVWDAALKVYELTGELPTGIAMGAKGWSRLGRLRDAAGRPLFPQLGAANAMGSMTANDLQSTGPAGLPSVVTPGITDGTFVVYNAYGLEVYEYSYPMLESIEASVLGRQVAMASELAFYRPATSETAASDAGTGNAAGNGAVKIVQPV